MLPHIIVTSQIQRDVNRTECARRSAPAPLLSHLHTISTAPGAHGRNIKAAQAQSISNSIACIMPAKQRGRRTLEVLYLAPSIIYFSESFIEAQSHLIYHIAGPLAVAPACTRLGRYVGRYSR